MADKNNDYDELGDEYEKIAKQIVNSAYRIHFDLGPGLLESVYETCLAHKLRKAGLSVDTQIRLPIEYDGLQFTEGYRIDLLVEDMVIVELKSVSRIENVHMAQLLTYLKLSGKRLGFLINFNAFSLRNNIKRYVH